MTTTVKHVAERVGADERTLRRAVSQGTIRCERVSDRRIAIGDEETRYLSDHWQTLARLRATLRTEPNVRLAVLFGSLARGDDGERSDIDLLVELHDDSWERRQPLTTRIERTLDRPVDLASLSHVRSANPSLLSDVLWEGRVLVDRDDRWRALKRNERSVRRSAEKESNRQAEVASALLEDVLV